MTITRTHNRILSFPCWITVWETMDSSNLDGTGIEMPSASDRSVHVLGTFGGATMTIEGSNVAAPAADADWAILKDSAGNNLSFTSAGIQTVIDNVRHIRPKMTGATGTTDIDVYLLSKVN